MLWWSVGTGVHIAEGERKKDACVSIKMELDGDELFSFGPIGLSWSMEKDTEKENNNKRDNVKFKTPSE
jgi:hypothetical protein